MNFSLRKEVLILDSKFIERPKKFDKSAYNSNYSKTHYKRFAADIPPELMERVNAYCTEMGISKPEFIRRAIEALEKE